MMLVDGTSLAVNQWDKDCEKPTELSAAQMMAATALVFARLSMIQLSRS